MTKLKKRFPLLPWIKQLKCIRCPYHLGLIKCVRDPCRECMESKRKTHPFQHVDFKEESCVKSQVKHTIFRQKIYKPFATKYTRLMRDGFAVREAV